MHCANNCFLAYCCSTDVIEAASEVLKAVFGTKKSVEFKEEYSRIISGPEGLLQYLQPFMKSVGIGLLIKSSI